MALITASGLILVGVLTALLSSALAAEFRAWSPSIIRILIKFAVGRLPENQRQRFEEEWQSHVNDVPGHLGKILVAVGFSIAAYDVAFNDRRNQLLESRVNLLAKLTEADSAMDTVVNLIQNDQLLASREDLCSLVNTLTSIRSGYKERCSRLATLYEEIASATSHGFVKSLWHTLADSDLRRMRQEENHLRGRVSQGATQIKELAGLIVKRLEQRRKAVGR